MNESQERKQRKKEREGREERRKKGEGKGEERKRRRRGRRGRKAKEREERGERDRRREKQKQGVEIYLPKVSVETEKNEDKNGGDIKNNGDGIPQKGVDKIFQTVYTTKASGQGKGLGFSLSYDIIKAHGGGLKVNTSENAGAEFIVELPAT